MSTFDGFVPEFPQIRVDYFRLQPHRPSPLACFLSHIHSDHLVGLEYFKGPFIYCSAATREILLRLQRKNHRMNFAKGVTEVRQQTYKHLHKLIRPIPLETPTRIELAPGNTVNVTLFDANHCSGAVMFLFEGSGRSVLYTGDIRAEAWWLDALTRSPFLIPYIPVPLGAGTKRLDCIYLDTTFAIKSAPFRTFQSKSQGLAELLRKVAAFPPSTTFYFHAWTFGYEDVLRALGHVLSSRVHLDSYRHSIYTSLAKDSQSLNSAEVASFSGFVLGNTRQESILTQDPSVRLHSCEQGNECWATDPVAGRDVVHIKPVVSRHDGEEIDEAGLGGGHGDLDPIQELELGDANTIKQLMELCEKSVDDPALKSEAKGLIAQWLQEQRSPQEARLRLDMDLHTGDELSESIKLTEIVSLLLRKAADRPAKPLGHSKLITFPYSRHSSYEELRLLVERFRPCDVFPCTAPKPADFDESKSMRSLFGDACHDDGHGMIRAFRWDEAMLVERQKLQQEPHHHADDYGNNCGETQRQSLGADLNDTEVQQAEVESRGNSPSSQHLQPPASPRQAGHHRTSSNIVTEEPESVRVQPLLRSPRPPLDASRSHLRKRGFDAVANGQWATVRLQSTSTKRRRSDEEC